jgi:hypothetical protein
MGRLIAGIVTGLVAVFGTIWLTDMIGHLIHPMPKGLNIYNGAAVRAYIASMPPLALAFVLLAWFLGALVGGVVAASISRRHWTLWAMAGLVAALAILNVVMIPHPLLLQIGSVAAPLLGGLVASWIVRRRPAPVPADAA